jgi:hypothetical protein
MTLTVDIPGKVIQHAAETGVPVEQLVSRAIDEIAEEPLPPGFVRIGYSRKTPAEAGASIREIASRNTLGGLNIKDLINEGRRT